MMSKQRIVPFILLVIIALFSACDPNDAFYPDWMGDYSVKCVQTIYPDGERVEKFIEEDKIRITDPDGRVEEQERDFEAYPPLSIFYEKSSLYVQALGIGNPFNPDVDSANHILIVRSPKRAIPQNDSIESEGIEDVELTDKCQFLLVEGMVFTVYNAYRLSPNPIRVIHARLDSLVLQDGEKFDVTLRDNYGSVIGQALAHWEYGPIKNEQGLCTWDAALYVYRDNVDQPDIYRHHLTFGKK